ncbi:Signal-transduction histidine kinase senX3 [Clostridiales bacterium CHKCI001]|nr:Signal-transduction histidine kinase senX3 [Clostridiales bacterium CHKCI001]
MKRLLNKRRWMLIAIAFVEVIILFLVLILTKNMTVFRIMLVGGLVVIGLALYQNRVNEDYLTETMQELSNLIAQITSQKDAVLSISSKDTLMEKLQSQIRKLAGILRTQKRYRNGNETTAILANLSEQLKTAAGELQMYSDFLQEPDLLEEEREEYMEIMEKTIHKFTFSAESMIKMSRLETGLIRLHPKLTDLKETIIDAVMKMHYPAKMRHIEIIWNEPVKEINAIHDPYWTVEAIGDILDNAIKYSPQGSQIIVSLNVYKRFARIDIQDQGKGVPEEEQAKIFQMFYRGSNIKEEEGTGIGLYLCRKVIMDQNGYVEVKSDQNGSKFSIFLPCD